VPAGTYEFKTFRFGFGDDGPSGLYERSLFNGELPMLSGLILVPPEADCK
jgi:hypothetical protein